MSPLQSEHFIVQFSSQILRAPQTDHIYLSSSCFSPLAVHWFTNTIHTRFSCATSTTASALLLLSTWLNPVYLTEPLKVCEPTRQLRFSSDSFILCFPLPCACTHSLSQRSFSYIVPSVWNTNQGQKGSTYIDYKPRLKREHLHRLQTEAKMGAPTRNTNRG